MSLYHDLWHDERGAIVSAELVAISTVLIGGLTVGLNSLRESLTAELQDFAGAMRSLDQQAIMYGQVAYNQPLDMPEGQPGEEVATDENAPVLMPLWTPEPTAPADPAAAAEFEGVDAVL